MTDTHVVVLAAGQGTRMKSSLPKVLHHVGGKPLIRHVLGAAQSVTPASITLVVGHKAEQVKHELSDVSSLQFAVQEPQLGTAHALLQAEPLLRGLTGTLVLLSGDVPLLRAATLQSLLAKHTTAGAAATVLTAEVERPFGYGRIVREAGAIARIVEEKDATPAQKEIREINSGIYAFDLGSVFGTLRSVSSTNAQKEFYLTDLVALFRSQGRIVETATVSNVHEIMGINSRIELAEANRVARQVTNDALMAAGVTLVDPATTYIGPDVVIGPDTIVHPGCVIEGHTRLGANCEIQAHVRIVNCDLGDEVEINSFCLLVDSTVGPRAHVGPFAHLRPGTVIGENAKVGNFVELKKTTLGPGAKANHLSYLGDATVGANANIGAGAITCNYDGMRKHQTVIEEGAFIGSDSQLIAPVTIGKGAYVGTGTTVREDVPPGTLAVSAGKQRNIEGWVERKRRSATTKK